MRMAGDERRARLAAARVYLILTVHDDEGAWEAPLLAALQSGAVDVVQLRDVRGDERATVGTAASLQMRCQAFDALFVLNDRPDLAATLDLDGAHVGQEDMPPAEARVLLGPDRLLGLSTHDADEIAAARRALVDYVGLGPCFASATKRLVRAPRGPDLVAACRGAAGDLPMFPIGGITPANVGALAAAGALRAAVGAGILAAADPAAAARSVRDAFPPR